MPQVRECDRCHSKMPFGRRRIRTKSGELICPGCAAGAPGTRMHGSVSDSPRCPNCGDEVRFIGAPGEYEGVDPWTCDGCGLHGVAEDLEDPSRIGYGDPEDHTAMRHVAHDSGDGETIYHCPFCGGGQVWARSDGTTQCDFCQAAFTVQVQPLRSAMPQTVNGQPVDVPGMPGTPGTPGQAPSQEAAGGSFQPPEAEAPVFDPPDPVVAHYITATGGVLPEDSYLRHLAIAHADDRSAVIDAVRADRSRRG